MPLTPEMIQRLVEANASAMNLQIAAEYRAGVVRYFSLAAEMAELVDTLPLGRHDESGSVFVPVSPEIEE